MNMIGSQLQDEHVLYAKNLAMNRFLRENSFANVVGIGIGKKVVGGTPTDTDCVRIYVQSKLDIEDIRPASLLPSDFSEVPIDVIEIGVFRRAGRKLADPRPADPPYYPGFPIRFRNGRPNVSPAAVGTLGAVVKYANGASNELFILSCNHVLAVNGRANGLSVVSGALADSGNENLEHIATTNGQFREIRRDEKNLVDCAVASGANGVSPKFPEEIGELSSPVPIPPYRGMKVKKYGAATHFTEGTIVDIDADFFIDYTFGTFRFTNQVVIDSGADETDFATDGDSGSIVVGTVSDTREKGATAMVFAEAGRFAVACPLETVFRELESVLGKKIELVMG